MRYALVTAALVTVLGGGMGAASATAAPPDHGHGHGDGDICILDEQPCT
jgi:hypothetical protein